MRKVLITGATGFIGGHIVKENIARGNAVRALVLPGDPGEKSLKERGVEILNGDIRDYDKVREAVDGRESVFHCAAVVTDWAPKKMFWDITVRGAENMAKAATDARVRRLVDMSTCDVFGTDESIVMDETLHLKYWGEPYPDSKIDSEKIMWRYHKEKGLPVTMVYPLWVYGEGDQTFVPLLADSIIKREMIFWRKNAIVWPTYIDNLVDLLMLISVDDRAVGNGYLVHDGEHTTLEEFCDGIAAALKVPPIRTYIPYWSAMAAARVMEFLWRVGRVQKRPLLTTYTVTNLGSQFRFSIEKAERELGWKPKITYKEGFKLTMEWLRTLDVATLKQK
ncbi:MAG: NAD-dependent epimerase/dehydratase family protein [Dehalococcoidia bacterium]|nr:NAD-dependent epimerase/dehydratase family protein [Dehalococcoidia bacterium]